MVRSAKMGDLAAIALKVQLRRKYYSDIKMLPTVLGKRILWKRRNLLFVVLEIANTGKIFFIDGLL